MGRRWNDTMPPAVRSRASASVTNRWCSANATTRAIITVAFLGPSRATHGRPGLESGEPPAAPAANQDGDVRHAGGARVATGTPARSGGAPASAIRSVPATTRRESGTVGGAGREEAGGAAQER